MTKRDTSGVATSMRSSAGKSEGVRREQSQRTELHLLRTATALFSERGFHGTSIRDIAESAGMAVSAMYYYARSKNELLEEIMRRGLDRLQDSARQSLDEASGSCEQLASIIGTHVAFHARNPRTALVVDQEFGALPDKVRKGILAERDAYEEIWTSVISDGVRAGEFVDREGLAHLALLEMCTGVAHWYKPRGGFTIPQLCIRFANMGLALLGASRDGEPVTTSRLDLPDPEGYLSLVDIASEPRRRRPRTA